MKKLILTSLAIIGMIGSSIAQMAIPGEVFAQNPARFNGRKVTLNNIEIVKVDPNGGPLIGGPAGTFQGAPGAAGSPTGPATQPCRPPRGFSEVQVFFKGAPEYKACFFMGDMMKKAIDREMGHENAPALITFRGDSRTGYNISLIRLGVQ